MPLVDIRVELPAFSRTINIQVADSGTVLDVKREIYRVCVGAPRVEGQRIIWRGRSLLDTEKVQELWQSPNEPRIVHLAVHPSAWSSAPPDVPQPPPAAAPSLMLPPPISPFVSTTFRRPSIFAPANPLAYVLARHQQAFNALEQLSVVHLDSDALAARFSAVQAVERHGWSWPSILDDEFPPATEGGVKYERVVLEGQSYLRFVEGDQPSAIQLHALNVLASTFPILALPATIPPQTRVTTSHALQNVPNMNALLQQLGLPPAAIRNGANGNLGPINIAAAQAAPAPEIPLRPLLLPLFLLVLRTAVLLYFFAPARKPVFGILIVMWMLYEVWRPIRDGVQRGLARVAAENANQPNQPNQQAQQQQQPQRNGAAAPPAANGHNHANAGALQQRQAAVRPGGQAANDLDHQIAAAFDGLANYNVQAEEETIRRGTPVEEPSFSTKAMAFVTLLLTTVHPAVWNRRRAVLRQREGQIRMDANARAAELDENTEDPQAQARIQRRAQLIAQHEARPRWLREYMDRAVEGGWVDEAD